MVLAPEGLQFPELSHNQTDVEGERNHDDPDPVLRSSLQSR